MTSISEQLDNVPGLSGGKPYVTGHIPWDKFDLWEIEGHIEIMGILREDIGTFRRWLEKDDVSERLRILINNQIVLDQRCIEHSMTQIRKLRNAGKEAEQGTTEGLRGPGQGDLQL
jgi:hypothetical protein